MSKERIKLYRLDAGLNTTTVEQSGYPGVYQVMQNSRVAQGPCGVRKGMKRLATISADSTATIIDADGTNDVATGASITDVWPLGTVFTVEFLCQADTLGGDVYILGSGGAAYGLRVKQKADSTIIADFQDSATTVVSLTSAASFGTGVVVAGQLVRDGSTITMRLNNATAVTGTMNATNLMRSQSPSIYAHNGANFYDGRIEWVRGFSVAKSNQNDCWTRHPNPRAPDVLFDYVTNIDAGTGYVLDRSRFENHLDVAGSPATTATLLGNPPMVVQSISPFTSKLGTRNVAINARGRTYIGSW